MGITIVFVLLYLSPIGAGIFIFGRYLYESWREAHGESPKPNANTGNLTENNISYIEAIRSELEEIKQAREATENEQRSKYVFYDGGDNMDDIYSFSPQNDRTE